jgi:AcrR family transcriptional regulator
VRVRLTSDARRAQLLELGIAIFAKRSWDEVQIDDVADAAGISKGLLYHYFPTKRDFYVEVVREAARRLIETTETSDETPPIERLTTGLSCYLRFVEEHAATYSTLLRGGIGSDADTAAIIEATRREFLTRLARGIGLDEPAPALRLIFRGWLGFVEATSLDWLDRRDLSREALLDLWSRTLAALVPMAVAH